MVLLIRCGYILNISIKNMQATKNDVAFYGCLILMNTVQPDWGAILFGVLSLYYLVRLFCEDR